MNERIRLRLQGLTNSQIQAGAYALILAEEDGKCRIPVIIGTAEAQSIAIALEHINPPRPLTHDLFISFAQSFGIQLLEVLIYRFEDGVFYSEILFSDGKDNIRIDSRTSDAIALAIRVNCPIYTTPQIVKECGVEMDKNEKKDDGEESMVSADDYLLNMEPEEIKDPEQLKRWLSLLDEEELDERLEDAVNDEKYEFAKMYRDEINRRKDKNITEK